MKRIVLIASLLVLGFSLKASDGDDDFSPDRPGMATGPGVLGSGLWQFETGFGYEAEKQNGGYNKTFTLNTSMLRYGISDNAELRLQLDGFGVKEAGSNKLSAFLAAPVTFAALCLDFSITESTGAFLETYNYFSKGGEPSFNLDFGFSWNVLDNLQLDLFSAINLNNISSYLNVGFGLVWLIEDFDD